MSTIGFAQAPDFRTEPEKFVRWCLEIHSLIQGEDGESGDLDEKNIVLPIANVDDDLEISGEWTFLTHPLGLDHTQIAHIGTNTHDEIDEHIADTNDDHTRYFHLAGRSGGQIGIGGTDSGDDLLFQSTSHATTGLIAFTSFTNGLIWDEDKKSLSLGSDEFDMTVGGVTKDHAFTIHNQGGSNAYDVVFHRHSASSGPFLAGTRSRGSEASETVVQDGDNLLDIFGLGFDGTDYEFAAGIRFEVDGAPGDDDMPGRIILSTTPSGSGTLADIMMLNSTGHVVYAKASDKGIKIDLLNPTYGFADLLGDQFSKNTGATKPILATYNAPIEAWQFSDGDEAFMTFHIPHDYVIGTDIFLHIHWDQNNVGATGGTIDFKYSAVYAKGHNQVSGSTFTATPITDTFSSIDIDDGGSGLLQYQQHLTEVIISGESATLALFDRDDFEPDGVIELTLEMDANNLTGTPSDPFIHYVDIHYQTTGLIGTKDKAPDFYT